MTKEEQIKAWFDKNTQAILIATFELKKDNFSIKDNYEIFLYVINELSKNIANDNLIRYLCMVYVLYKNVYFKCIYGSSLLLLKDTLILKNRDYGNSFDRSMDKFGWVYLAIELDKKKNRLKNLLRNKQAPNYESLEDTLLDIAGYCVLALIYLENKERE